MPFKPGQSGNPNGRPTKPIEERSLDEFKKRFGNGNFAVVLEPLAKQVQKGNVRAIELVFEYLLGKPAQSIDLQSAGELKVTVEYKRADDTTT